MPPKFHIGMLRESCTLQRFDESVPVPNEPDDGQRVRTVIDVCGLFAAIVPAGGFESSGPGSVGGVGQFDVVIRYRDDLFAAGPRWQLRWNHPSGQRLLGIESVQPVDAQRRFLQLRCTENADVRDG